MEMFDQALTMQMLMTFDVQVVIAISDIDRLVLTVTDAHLECQGFD